MAGSPDPFFHCHEILPERFIRLRREELGEIGTVNESVASSSETNLLRRFGGKVTGSGRGSMFAICSKSFPEIIFSLTDSENDCQPAVSRLGFFSNPASLICQRADAR